MNCVFDEDIDVTHVINLFKNMQSNFAQIKLITGQVKGWQGITNCSFLVPSTLFLPCQGKVKLTKPK